MALSYENHIFEKGIPLIYHTSLIRSQASPHDFGNWHVNTEILVVKEGTGYFERDAEVVAVRAGDVFVIPPDKIHSAWSEDYLRYDCLIIDRDFCEENGFPTDFVTFPSVISGSEELLLKIDALHAAHVAENKYRSAAVKCALLSLLLSLYPNYATSFSSHNGEEGNIVEIVRETMKFVHENYGKHITLDEIAGKMGISRFYLCREFRRLTGQTLFQYINVVRCKSAHDLIDEGCSVSEAAMASGFENVSYFTRTYKRYFGMLPSAGLARRR